MLPYAIIEKGTKIRIGEYEGIDSRAWGALIQLSRDTDNTNGRGYIDNGIVLQNPNGWPFRMMNHTVRPRDMIEYEVSTNSQAKFLLNPEY